MNAGTIVMDAMWVLTALVIGVFVIVDGIKHGDWRSDDE